MEIIARALQRAKTKPEFSMASGALPVDRAGARSDPNPLVDQSASTVLSPSELLSRRVVAHDSNHRITRSYDVLRNQLTTLNEGGSPGLLAVTSPTAGCGTTTAAANLAFSFARVRGANVLLIDTNLRAPSVKSVLGIASMSHSESSAEQQDLAQVEVDGLQIHVFCPHYDAARAPMKSDIAQLSRQIEAVRRTLKPSVTILDLPPMLVADETAALAANADAVVLVLAVGQSKLSELEICKTYLDAKNNVQVVLNKCRRHGL